VKRNQEGGPPYAGTGSTQSILPHRPSSATRPLPQGPRASALARLRACPQAAGPLQPRGSPGLGPPSLHPLPVAEAVTGAGPKGLEEKSRRPKGRRRPNWSPEVVVAVLRQHQAYPAWGKKKLTRLLQGREGPSLSPQWGVSWPICGGAGRWSQPRCTAAPWEGTGARCDGPGEGGCPKATLSRGLATWCKWTP
jgi:hypothetical protein